LSGETEQAKRIVTDFRLLDSVPPISRFRQAALSLAFGDREHSLSFLAKALEDREAELVWIGVDPRFDSIRNEKKFQTAVKTVFPGLTSPGNNPSLGATH
jgi:hypothetical protein